MPLGRARGSLSTGPVPALRVAIAGAGIGGLTAALAFARGGHDVTVLERRTGFGEGGAGIQLSPNASRVLIGLGLGPALDRVASEPERMVVRDLVSGRVIGQMRLGDFARERYAAPYWFVGRSDLHTALLDAVRSQPSIRLRVGRSFSSLAQLPSGIEVMCEAGTGSLDRLEADLLVGADGLWSRTRAALGDQRPPEASGFVAYRSTIAREAAPPDLQGNEGGLWLGPGRHLVHYPIAGARLLNVVAVERMAGTLSSWSSPVEAERVSRAFGRAAPALRDLIRAGTDWSAWSLYDLPLGSMTGERVALIGDAAHAALPFLAQGGALAIEDAVSLASEVGKSPDDVPVALQRYSAARHGRARRVQAGARRNARTYHAGRLVGAVRNVVMRRLGPEGMTARYGWIYGRPSPRLA